MTSLTNKSSDLLPRIAAGERAIADELMDRYGGLVWSLARRFSSSATDAEDATQEIFVELWRVADRFDPKVASEATFVAMIARRRLIDRRRRAERGPTFAADELWRESERFAAVDRSSPAEDVQRAAEALRECSQAQQDVLRLTLLDGMSHERIAQALDMPLGTVKTHARRGLLKLREAVATSRGRGSREVAS
ncbi:MAG: sigma-70 family RNA polymerase sigma factor [Phycisphaerales bacterium]|nr:sigma-70 family RNA polymerase sigma factor [Phycisphaerales bacterium]